MDIYEMKLEGTVYVVDYEATERRSEEENRREEIRRQLAELMQKHGAGKQEYSTRFVWRK
jgi:hypothetical protein